LKLTLCAPSSRGDASATIWSSESECGPWLPAKPGCIQRSSSSRNSATLPLSEITKSQMPTPVPSATWSR
jgi:hypothetical protein